MTTRKLFIILLSIAASIVCIYFGAELLIASLSGTPGEKLSPKERKMVKDLKSTYKCNVRIIHNSKAVKPMTTDSVVNIYFSWKSKDQEEKDTAHNMALKDDSTIIHFANDIVKRLIDIVPQKEFYNRVNVKMSDIRVYDGKISHTDKEFKLEYSITSDEELLLTDFAK